MTIYKALLFDLDNTLVDFTQAEAAGLNKVYTLYFQNHLPPAEFQERYKTINKRLWSLVEGHRHQADFVRLERFKLLAEQINVSVNPMAVAQTYTDTISHATRWYPEVKSTLHLLKQQFRLGIITNGLADVQQTKHDRLQIGALCDCFIVSGAIGYAKPQKAIFKQALAQLQLANHEALMIGDSLSSDYQGAINAELDFCWVNPENYSLPTKFPKPKYTVRSVNELPHLLVDFPKF